MGDSSTPAANPASSPAERAALPEDWPVTRYEEKLLAGHPPMFFRYRRV